jgi:hypothetical protein
MIGDLSENLTESCMVRDNEKQSDSAFVFVVSLNRSLNLNELLSQREASF